MKVTIIIVTFRSENVINACLSRINKSYPVIVVENSDNETDDETEDLEDDGAVEFDEKF
jgi:GT2 family glycosyltransferase